MLRVDPSGIGLVPFISNAPSTMWKVGDLNPGRKSSLESDPDVIPSSQLQLQCGEK